MENFEIFESLTDFSRALNTRKANKFYVDNGETSRCTSSSTVKFSGTKDYQTADSLLLNGDKKNAEKVQKALSQRIKVDGKGITPQRSVYCSQQGFVPNVGRVMTGHPQNMFNMRRELRDSSKVITIVYDSSVPSFITVDEIIKAGAKLLSAVNALEKSGYRCNICVGMFANIDTEKNGRKDFGVLVKIKDSGKMLDVTRIAYPLVNPSLLRRHCLAWIERRENTRDPFYGKTLDAEKSKSAIKDSCPKLEGAYFANFDLLNSSENVIETLKENRI